MKVISHRGNINCTNPIRENKIWAIEECIEKGYLVEVDLWVDYFVSKQAFYLYLSHDKTQINDIVSFDWLIQHQYKLLVHCKNKEAIEFAITYLDGDWFCHDQDRWAKTNNGKLICYGKLEDIIENEDSLLIMPEHHGIEPEDVKNLNIGYVCTDYVEKWNDYNRRN